MSWVWRSSTCAGVGDAVGPSSSGSSVVVGGAALIAQETKEQSGNSRLLYLHLPKFVDPGLRACLAF